MCIEFGSLQRLFLKNEAVIASLHGYGVPWVLISGGFMYCYLPPEVRRGVGLAASPQSWDSW